MQTFFTTTTALPLTISLAPPHSLIYHLIISSAAVQTDGQCEQIVYRHADNESLRTDIMYSLCVNVAHLARLYIYI